VLVALTIVWAAWAGWSLIGRATPFEMRVLDDLGQPIAGAFVDKDGSQLGTTADDGQVTLDWRSNAVLGVTAPGHVTKMVTLAERPQGVVEVVLTARFLRGQIVDQAGLPVQAARVLTPAGEGVSDGEGRFDIRGAEPGEVTVERPAWFTETLEWDGGPGEISVTMRPFVARAVHITGNAVRDNLAGFLQMAADTELNALMIDLKDERGRVWYETANPTAIEVGAKWEGYTLADVVAQAAERDLYVIGRLVVFNDPLAAVAKPSMAVLDETTNAPANHNEQYFLDPTDPETRQYGLELAVEACSLGVDEIQFDYVRFQDQGLDTAVFDQELDEASRVATINGFLTEAVALLHPMGCAVGADVFGFITTAADDGQIGQYWEDVTSIVDVVSPMVYPSHYSTGWFGFDVPNDHPGPMVTNALSDGISRLPRNVVVRPWLQDFGYTADQVKAQIDSAEALGLGWMLWNAASEVTVGALGGPE
jgi:hypothetical protein